MNKSLNHTKNNNVVSSSTPNRELDTKFRTPVNRFSAHEWSPNVQFATPILVSSPSLELPRTPAMLASLGIQPEADADVSWQSCMATPSSVSETIGNTVYHTPTNSTDGKSNAHFQAGFLTRSTTGDTTVEGKVCNVDRRLPVISEVAQSDTSSSLTENHSSNNQDSLLGLITKKTIRKFIYPKPVYIKMKHGGPTAVPAQESNQTRSTSELLPESEEDIAPSPVISQRQRRKKKARKNLQFSEIPSSGSSLLSQGSCGSMDMEQPKCSLAEEPNLRHQPSSSPEMKHSTATLVGFSKITDITRGTSRGQLPALDRCTFSTAGGRQIPVSDTALIRAKALFQDVENEPGISHDFTVKDSICKPTPGDNSVKSQDHARKSYSDSRDDWNRQNDGEQKSKGSSDACGLGSGFSTAGGKRVVVSERRLLEARKMFDDCYDSEGANYSPHLTPLKAISASTNSSVGFSTASGKSVAISTKALDRARKLFDDCDKLEEATKRESLVPGSHCSSVTSDAALKTAAISAASGRGAASSTKSSTPAQRIFECGQSDTAQDRKSSRARPDRTSTPILSSTSGGFSTASGKGVAISAKSLAQAKQIYENCQSDSDLGIKQLDRSATPVSTPTGRFGTAGFSTASGKGVAISAKSLARAKQIFEDCQSEWDRKDPATPTTSVSTPVGCTTAPPFAEKRVAIPAKLLAHANQVVDDDQPERYREKREQSSARMEVRSIPSVGNYRAAGFSTARGKEVAVSAESLAKATKIFEDCQSVVESSRDGKNPSNRLSTGPSSRQARTCNSAQNAEPVDFNAASAKGVCVSGDSLARAEQLLEKCEFETSEERENSWHRPATSASTSAGKSSVAAFSTASGKGIALSAESLARAKQLYETCKNQFDEDTGCRNQRAGSSAVPTAGTAGFSTASGKNVKISSEALDRAKHMFVEESDVPARKNGHQVSHTVSGKEGDDVSHRKRKMEEESDSDRSPSPTIGKKKRKDSPLTADSHELQLTQTQFSIWDVDPTCVAQEILVARRRARHSQRSLIEAKKNRRIKVVASAGMLYSMKKSSSVKRKSLAQFTSAVLGKTSLPPALTPDELMSKGLLPSVCSVHSGNAASFKFYGWEYFSLESCRSNAQGFRLGEFQLVLADDNTVGCDEIAASFLASSNVDPSLVTEDWIRNHYRWIVWKLASMEQRFPEALGQQCLNPANVLEQLKYRYDREIDGCQRSALRRIIEQDDTAAKTMILCVSAIGANPPAAALELTDGWYSIRAQVDPFFKHLMDNGKIFVGLKLVISGAELVAPGPSSPLEMGADTYLKVSANSVRRARWSSRLGFYVNPQPFAVALRSILPEGGLVSLVRVLVARIYPVVFMEKAAEGKTLFRSERYYRKVMENVASDYERMMEKMMEDIERETDEQERNRRRLSGNRSDLNLTDEEKRHKIQMEAQKRMEQLLLARKKTEGVAVLRMRLVDWQSKDSTSAVLSVWRPGDDIRSMIKENQTYRLYHVNTSGLRFGEIQLNSVKNTRWDEIKDVRNDRNQTLMASAPQFQSTGFQRTVTCFQAASQRGFKPPFNELDLVGLVVHVAKPPNKNSFQTAVLYDGSEYFGVKCWGGFDDYALEDVILTGAYLGFCNLNWRANSSSGRMPFAFIGEATVVSSRPAAKHLDQALSNLKQLLSDPAACVAEAEAHLAYLLSNNGTAGTMTPSNQSMNEGKMGLITPANSTDGRTENQSSSNQGSRSRFLEKYGPPPSLLPLHITPSSTVRQRFKPPAKKPPAV